MRKRGLLNLQNSEWLSKILLYRKMTPRGATSAFFFFYFICSILFALGFDAWNPSGSQRGLSNDIPSWGFGYLLQPITLGALCWIQSSATQMFNTLFAEGIFPNKSKFLLEINNADKKIKNRLLPFMAFLIGGFITTAFVLAFLGFIPAPVLSWLTANPVPAISLSPFYFVSIYALVIFMYDLFVVINTLDKLVCSQRIRIEPLNPDNAGGLGSVGGFISSLGYFMSAVGTTLLISALYDLDGLFSGRDYALVVYILVYLILVPIIFFRPLWMTHKAMVRSRDAALHELSEKFNVLYSKLLNTKSQSRPEVTELREELKHLSDLHKLTKNFPTWPYNIDNFRKYFSASLSPILGIAIPPLIDFGLKLFLV